MQQRDNSRLCALPLPLEFELFLRGEKKRKWYSTL
jgi:hypothetical protein